MRAIPVAVFLVTLAASAAPLPFPKPKKAAGTTLDEMQGLWEVKSRVSVRATFSLLTTQRFVRVQGKAWTFLRADQTSSAGECDLTLDATTKPATLDLSYPARSPLKGVAGMGGPYMVGRVEVEGDTMRLCYALRTNRPGAMKPAEAREYLITLQRVKKP